MGGKWAPTLRRLARFVCADEAYREDGGVDNGDVCIVDEVLQSSPPPPFRPPLRLAPPTCCLQVYDLYREKGGNFLYGRAVWW